MNSRVLVLWGVATSLFFVSSARATQNSNLRLSPEILDFKVNIQNTPSDLCSVNSILSGQNTAIVFKNSEHNLNEPLDSISIIGSKGFIFRGHDNFDAGIGLEGIGLNFHPFQWSSSESLYLRLGTAILELDTSSNGASLDAIFKDPRLLNIRILSNKNGNIDLSKIKNHISNDNALRSFLIISSPYFYSSKLDLNISNSSFSEKDDDFNIEKVSPFGIYRPNVYRGRGGINFDFLGRSTDKSGLLYSRALVDRKNGKSVGYFGFNRINFYDFVKHKNLGGLIENKIGTDKIILDASYHDSDIYILYQKTSGAIGIFHASQDGFFREKEICSQKYFGDGIKFEVDQISIPRRSLSSKSLHAVIFRAKRESRSKNLCVVFHGGPASVSYLGNIPANFFELAKTGCDVVFFEYSGSAGAGQANLSRLSKRPVQNLLEDAESIKNWSDGQNYDNIDVISFSYGSVPAFALRSIDFKADYHFVMPLLSLEHLFNGLEKNSEQYKRQILFDKEIYGSSNNKKLLENALNGWRATSNNTNYIFASNDEISVMKYLNDSEKKAPVFVINGTHSNLTKRSNFWKQLIALLEAPS